MKNICLVTFCNLYYLPYASLYIDKIVASGVKCTLLFWDRDAVNGENDLYPQCNEKIVFQYKEMKNTPGLAKAWGYVKAACFFNKILKERDFSGVVFLQTQCAVACCRVLKKKYRKCFILDIRDYFFDDVPVYRQLEKSLIDISYANVISSPAYKYFLPKGEYYISHNYTPFDEVSLKRWHSEHQGNKSDTINITYVGTVRFIDMDKSIIGLFANDNRFSINYYGRGSEVLEAYCKEKGICNVKFHGSFSPTQVLSFYQEADLINNLYGNHTKELDYALSNKIYHAGQLELPILVCPGTFMEEVSMKYHIGFVFDVNKEGVVDELYNWYQNFDTFKFREGCKVFIKDVINENEEFNNVCKKFIESVKE